MTMSTAAQVRLSSILAIASICHEANRRVCRLQGDDSQPAWTEAPEWQQESAIVGVEAIAEGRVTRPEQSHESWLEQKRADGWQYGAVKDAAHKLHPCFVPYADLPSEQRVKDHVFFAIASAMLLFYGLQAPAAAVALPTHEEPILRFFEFGHLPPMLQSVSQPFAQLAGQIVKTPRSAERTVALRKLLESKDAAVRASLPA